MTEELRNQSYAPIEWEDRVIDEESGDILVEGTAYNEVTMNRMESGILLSHLDVSLVALTALQQASLNGQELKKIKNQRLLQGRATINNALSDDGYFRSADPFVTVALSGYAQINAPDYDIVLTSEEDSGDVGNLLAYDKTQNGFKVKMTGSATSVSFLWTLINPRV
ncbi:signal transduction protein [Bacillaceae bacterium IKA-2]|nr:signal transduction protein [Bacillaceae bacterium IKA-2]